MRALLARLPLTLRALVLLPLLSAGIDQARVSLACGPDAQSCLETAGQGGLGFAGTMILVGYALAIATLVARLVRGRKASPLLWLVATAGLWAACGGQALLVELVAHGAPLGGGWLPLLGFGVLAGAALALALRAVPAALNALRPSAPRLVAVPELIRLGQAPAAVPPLPRFARLARDRAPPALA